MQLPSVESWCCQAGAVSDCSYGGQRSQLRQGMFTENLHDQITGTHSTTQDNRMWEREFRPALNGT